LPRAWRLGRSLFAYALMLQLAQSALGGGAGNSGEFLDDRLGTRTVPIFLLMRSDVQADLKLDPAQVAEARRTASELYYKARALRGQTGAALIAARRAIDSEESVWLSRHLSDIQYKRLQQIDLQWEGVAAMLNRPFVAEYLGLSKEQVQALARYIATQKPSGTGPVRWTPVDHERLARQAITVLSDSQKHLWHNLLGPACQFSIAAPSEKPAPVARGLSSPILTREPR
jgi:hypothetical protein